MKSARAAAKREPGGAGAADAAAALLRRGAKRTYDDRAYGKARADFADALALATGGDDAADGLLPREQMAELWAWEGLYRHLTHRLDGALDAYDRALALIGGGPGAGANDALDDARRERRCETLVKQSGVLVDMHDLPRADARLADAAAASPSSADVFMHRAQFHVIQRDLAAADVDLRRCLEACPHHVLARLRLATVLMHSGEGDAAAARAELKEAERLAPRMSEVFQVKGELALAEQSFDAAVKDFDRAIALDRTNPIPFVDKGLALLQTSPMEAPQARALFEKALEADPQCMVAHMRLAEIRLQMATTFDEANQVVSTLTKAAEKCRDREELAELCTVRAVAAAQIEAARELGMDSFN